MEHLATFFYPKKRGEFGNLKLEEPNFPTDRFSIKLLLSNASRPKSSKMKTMLQTFAKNWSSLEGSMSNGPNHQNLQNTASFSLFNMDHVKCPNNWLQIICYPWFHVKCPHHHKMHILLWLTWTISNLAFNFQHRFSFNVPC